MTKIKKIVRHDSLSVKAAFANGESIKFAVNRSGEKFEYALKQALTPVQISKLKELFKFQPEETNATRIDRLAAVFEKANTIAELFNNDKHCN